MNYNCRRTSLMASYGANLTNGDGSRQLQNCISDSEATRHFAGISCLLPIADSRKWGCRSAQISRFIYEFHGVETLYGERISPFNCKLTADCKPAACSDRRKRRARCPPPRLPIGFGRNSMVDEPPSSQHWFRAGLSFGEY